MKLKNKIFTAAICLAVLIALFGFSVGATTQGCVNLEFVSLTEGLATVDVNLSNLEGKSVDYVQIVLTPKATAQDKQVTGVTTTIENLGVEYQTAKNGKITILAVPTASGVAMAEGTKLCTLQISGVEAGSTLNYTVSYVLCFTDNTDLEETKDISVSIGAGTYKTTLQAETHGVLNRYKVSGSVVGGMTKDASKMMTLEQLQTHKGFGNAVGHPMVTYTVEVEEAGTYTIEYVYNVATTSAYTVGDYAITASINDETFTTVPFAPRDAGADYSASTNMVGKATMDVELVKGRNVIRMISCTADNAAMVSWMDHDYMDIYGPSQATGIVSTVNHLLPGQSQFVNKWTVNTLENTEAAGYAYRSTYLGGVEVYTFDGANLPIYELSGVPYVSYTVEVPVDGYYDLQTHLVTKTVADADEGHLLLIVDGIKYQKYICDNAGYIVNNNPMWTQYLTAGKHTIVVTSMYEHSYDGDFWCDMAALSVYGGVTLAAEQLDPMNWASLKQDVYVSATGDDTAAGTEDAPVASLTAAMIRVANGGTIHIVGTLSAGEGFVWYENDKAVTITGGTMDLTALSVVNINSPVTFKDVTLQVADMAEIFCNGNTTKIDSDVTVNGVALIFGGVSTGSVESTDLTVLSGTWYSIYGGNGGGAGNNTTVTGEAKLVVGGNVNAGININNHDIPNVIFGGSRRGWVEKTNVTVQDNAKALKVLGGGSGRSSADWCDVNDANVTVNGGSYMGIYGGNIYGPGAKNSQVTITINGGTVDQVFGGHEWAHANLNGNVNIYLAGGTILRRVYGGCYNNTSGSGFATDRHVVGNINVYIYEGVNLDCSSNLDRGVYAHSRYAGSPDPFSDENTAIYFVGQAAYDASYSKLTAQDSTMQYYMGNTSAADNIVTSHATVCVNGKDVQYCASAAEAISACADGQYVKLYSNQSADVTLTKDLYIDLNGHSLTGTVIQGEYAVYGMDTTTDSYGNTTGVLNCGVIPVKEFKTELTGSIRRYMAVETESGYTFNRFYMGITKTSLQPDVVGVGYRALFMGSDAVKSQVASYGYSLHLDGLNGITRTKDGFESGKELTLRVRNYDVVNYGETKLYATVILTLTDGTVIESAEYEMTLKDLVESVNANIDRYTSAQILAVQTMLANYELNWNMDKIKNYKA